MKLLLIFIFFLGCSDTKRFSQEEEHQLILEFAKKIEEHELKYKHNHEIKGIKRKVIPTNYQSNPEDSQSHHHSD